jgi:[ribosomal protein S18]-alanine N-acetyltransferase
MMSLPIHIRWMIRRDVAEVLASEARGTREPWSEETLVEALRAGDTIGMVAESSDGTIVGHMVYTLHKKRLELTRLAVAPEARRRGVGRKLVAKLFGKLSESRRPKLTCDVNEQDLDVCKLFRACGLIAKRILQGGTLLSEDDIYEFTYRVEWAAVAAESC